MAEAGQDWRQVRLANGLRLITVARPGTPTVAVRAYVRAGSRYDLAGEAQPSAEGRPLGLAHFTEHLLFKGTRSRGQREIFAQVERLGGLLEPATTKEYLAVSAVVPPQALATAAEMVAEVLTAPALREGDFWNEKLVVLAEIRRAQDRQSILYDQFAKTLWEAHPLRYPILGTLEGLQALQHEHLLTFYQQRYVAGNMVLVVCGDVVHEEAERLAARSFAGLARGDEQPPAAVEEEPGLDGVRTAHLDKDIHQTYLMVGVPTVSMIHEDRSPLKIVELVLGMGASARLYQRLREEAGLVYSISTVTANYEDAGYFGVQTSCSPDKVPQVREAILAQWQAMRREGVSEEELAAAKSNYAGTLARRFETNLALAGIFGVEGLLHHVETLAEAVARINAVQRDDVVRVARQYLDLERYVVVSMGRKEAHARREADEA